MDRISSDDIRELVSSQTGPCASIYLPTDPTGADGQQDPLRLKNLVSDAEKQFVAAGLRGPEAEKIVQPAKKLLTDELFWQGRSQGLAIFLAPAVARVFRLPIAFEPLATVRQRFCVRPVLSMLNGDGHFYVLALSQKKVRLLAGTRYDVDVVEVADLPQNMNDALNYDQAESVGQMHAGSPGRGKQAAVFHGQGAKADAHKDDLEKYCRVVDAALREKLRGQSSPLVLAAVDYLLPIYRRVNSYAHLLEASVPGNPDQLKPKQLHEKAWPLAGEHIEQERRGAWERYERLTSTDKTSADIEQIVLAAREGRTDTLFMTRGGAQWGALDPATGQPQLHTAREPGDEDLLEVAAAETLLHKGVVYTMETQQLPAGSAAVALFRYGK